MNIQPQQLQLNSVLKLMRQAFTDMVDTKEQTRRQT
mgnify:FL=1